MVIFYIFAGSKTERYQASYDIEIMMGQGIVELVGLEGCRPRSCDILVLYGSAKLRPDFNKVIQLFDGLTIIDKTLPTLYYIKAIR